VADHPVKVPQSLMEKWMDDWFEDRENADVLLIQAAQYGADQELEACCEWLAHETPEGYINALRAARRPKPPSLAEQALKLLEPGEPRLFNAEMQNTIRAALQRLAELEANQ
jgi:hypothetical protein